jgi:beta-aspartyl-dipeptidase (metallo-type)
MLTLIQQAEVHAPACLGICDVLIADRRIAAVAPHLDPRGLDAVLTRIDGRGLRLCPGLVDSLVHFAGGGGEGGFASRTAPLLAQDAINAGVTTLIGALGTDDVTRSHADLLATARALAAHGLTAYALTGSYRVPARSLTGSVRDDLVLIPDLIGVGEIAIADHRGSQPSPAELARIAVDAHVGGMLAGKLGTLLVHVGDGVEGLALLDRVCHQFEVDRTRFLPTHVNRNAALLAQGRGWIGNGGHVDLTTSTSRALIEAGDVPAARALATLLADGANPAHIGMSSDAQASLPHFSEDGRLLDSQVASIGSLPEALREAVHAHGVDFAIALATVSTNPARFWGLSGKGQIAVGGDADLVLLDPDSLDRVITVAGGRAQVVRADAPGRMRTIE